MDMPEAGSNETSTRKTGAGKRWLRRWPLVVLGIVALTAATSFMVQPITWRFVLSHFRSLPPPPDVPKPEFYFRIHADLVFDSEPVLLNGWVACRGDFHRRSATRWRTSFTLSTHYIGKRLKTGGSINVGVPSGSGLCFSAVRGDLLEGSWDLSGDSFPADFLPAFFWIDNADRPTKSEIYISEDYYTRPDARLQIIEFRVDGFTKTLPADALLLDEAATPPRETGAVANGTGYFGMPQYKLRFSGGVLRRIGYEEWRDIPEIAAFVEGLEDRQEIAVLRGNAYMAAWPLRRSASGTSSYGFGTSGIPRRDPERTAMFYISKKKIPQLLARLDSVIPMACDDGWLTPFDGWTGYWPLCAFPEEDKRGMRGVVYKGQRFENPGGRAGINVVLYDPAERALIVFENTHI